MPPHLLARPVLDRGGAADRMRNHLRRRAITRVGLIEGDLYLLPYWRASGRGPQGETSFHLLAAELGEPRLLKVDLPPADLKPFDSESAPPAACLVQASLDEAVTASRAAATGWQVRDVEALIHYPFWLMRVEDSGRIEGGWIDGVEGKVIHHTLKVPSPLPSLKSTAWMLAVPAAGMGLAAALTSTYLVAAALSAAAAIAAGATLKVVGEDLERRERMG